MTRPIAKRATSQRLLVAAFGVALAMWIPDPAVAQAPPTPGAPPACPTGRVAAGLNGEASLGITLTRSTTDENKATGGLSATLYPGSGPCVVPRWRTLLQLQGDYGDKAKSDAPKNVTRNYRADLQQMRLFGGGSTFLAASGRLRHNNTQGVDLQQLYTLTGGVIIRALGGLELSAGPGWSRIEFADTTGVSFPGVSLGESNSVVVPLGKVAPLLTQGVRIFLPLEEEGHTRVEAMGAIILNIAGPLDVSWNVWLDYVDDAPAAFEERYLNTAITLKLSF